MLKKAVHLHIAVAVALCWLASVVDGNAQTYKFRQYGIDKGLCHHTIYSTVQDRNGFIWFATGLGLCRYDGFEFYQPEDAPKGNVTTAFADSDKNLWFGYNDGQIVRYDGQSFYIADSTHSTSVCQITQTPAGDILVATQNEGLVLISDSRAKSFAEGMEEKLVYSVYCLNDRQLLLGCNDGLYLCSYSRAPFSVKLLARYSKSFVRAIVKSDRGLLLAAEGEGLYSVQVNGDKLSMQHIDIPALNEARIQMLYADEYGNIWVPTLGNGLFSINAKGELEQFNSSNGLGSDYIKNVFIDRQHNLWVGTYGQGVACLTDRSISFWSNIGGIENATAVLSPDSTEYWIAGRGILVKIKHGHDVATFTSANGLPVDNITALRKSNDGVLWIGTGSNGLYCLPKDAKSVRHYVHSANSLSNTIQNIAVYRDMVLCATRNGVMAVNTKTHSTQIINTYSGLPHNNIRDIFKDSHENVWIATNCNAILTINHWIDASQEERRIETGLGAEIEFSCITEDAKGNLWAGTNGLGVFRFDHSTDSVSQMTSQNGLKADYCYAITGDAQGRVWIGHRLGLSRIDIAQQTVSTFGVEYGITGDINPNALCENSANTLIAGMTDGVMVYKSNDQTADDMLPLLNLTSIAVGDKDYYTNEPKTLPAGLYRIRFSYIGLFYQKPADVHYQYMLEGYDLDWSEITDETSVVYPRLENGHYRFLVKAYNGNNSTPPTLLYELQIRTPFWKTWWFILLAAIALTSLIYTIIRIRERMLRRQQEHLERELDARTREVFAQKEEIEAKNRDITDSINYAQRIQFSVLPANKTLLDNCTDAFIFYQPRDIVSGDFYWFDYFPERNVILIVCADSTGHGVPGAFMSLIGTTLIKDIVLRPGVLSPSDILQQLDLNIRSTLNQNQESEMPQDGMDVIVYEINVKTLQMRVSSAMRPIVIVHDGKLQFFKGSHASIGGHYVAKSFDMIEMQMTKGDLIYMFTDGYVDQFGGPDGKKFKINRLRSVLEDISKRDMQEQLRVLRENFEFWKGDVDQVDDVLVIGIKL